MRAVYEVGLGRRPEPAELAADIARLRSGLGRDQLVAEFCARPQVLASLIGPPVRNPRRRLARLRGRLRVFESFSRRVEHAEDRQIDLLFADEARAFRAIATPPEPVDPQPGI